MKLTILRFAVCFAALIFNSTVLGSPAVSSAIDYDILKRVKALLDVPEEQIDFAYTKLAIDHMIDPGIDVDHEMQRLDQMVQAVNTMNASATTSLEKKDALRHYLYEQGDWNQNQPFTFDFSDPMGTNIKNKLLSNYLTSKKGNCISMPFLFIVLGQKLGLDVTASTAPLHVFVKYTDDATGVTYNLETTSGGNPARDSWMRQGFSMTDLAVENGIYLQKLTRQETVAVMANVLLQYYYGQKQFGQVVAIADLILDFYPKAISAVVYKASAYNSLLKELGLWQYRTPMEVPPEQREAFKFLISRVNGYHNQAVQMGWHQPSQEENETYLESLSGKQ